MEILEPLPDGKELHQYRNGQGPLPLCYCAAPPPVFTCSASEPAPLLIWITARHFPSSQLSFQKKEFLPCYCFFLMIRLLCMSSDSEVKEPCYYFFLRLSCITGILHHRSAPDNSCSEEYQNSSVFAADILKNTKVVNGK
jgi:hypothetical protein